MDAAVEAVGNALGAIGSAIGHGLSGEPHNDATLILSAFALAALFWHLVLWPWMRGRKRFWRAIDFVWYGGAFLSLVLGTYQVERDAEAARLRGLAQLIEVELQRQDLMLLALVTECGSGAGGNMFEPAQCAAAQPILRDARLFVFEHLSNVDTAFVIESKMARMTALCGRLETANRAQMEESDSGRAGERLYSLIYCDDAAAMAARVEAHRGGRAALSDGGPFG
ncbi:MAG: hypothetical protein AB7G39_19265, partial [Alphaproteobacteria bacterium]